MPDRRSFIDTIREHLDEDGPWLVYADWLEEQGECAHAELIKLDLQIREKERKLPPLVMAHEVTRLTGEFGREHFRRATVRCHAVDAMRLLYSVCDVHVMGDAWITGGIAGPMTARAPQRSRPTEVEFEIQGPLTISSQTPPARFEIEMMKQNSSRILRENSSIVQPKIAIEHLADFRGGMATMVACEWDEWVRHEKLILDYNPIRMVHLATWPRFSVTEDQWNRVFRVRLDGVDPPVEMRVSHAQCYNSNQVDLVNQIMMNMIHHRWPRIEFRMPLVLPAAREDAAMEADQLLRYAVDIGIPIPREHLYHFGFARAMDFGERANEGGR